MALLRVENLSFEYPKKKILKNINFEIPQGSVTALVGPNGAGKTTLMRCITSLETPMTGHVHIDDIDVHDNPREAHRIIGYLSDFFGVYKNLTVRQCLTYMAWCQKVKTDDLPQYIEELAADVDLTTYIEAKAGSLSRGYTQRLGVALALVHAPKYLFLDEPASGLDPEARIKFSELMIRLRNRGVTVIVSSHILAELEDYCTDMLVIRDGEIKSHVKLSEHEEQEGISLLIGIADPSDAHMDVISASDCVEDCKITETGILVSFSGDQDAQAKLLKTLVTKKMPVHQFTPIKKTLQSAYMDLAEKKEIKIS